MRTRIIQSCQSEQVHHQMSPSLKSHVSAGCSIPSSITALLWQQRRVRTSSYIQVILSCFCAFSGGNEQGMCARHVPLGTHLL